MHEEVRKYANEKDVKGLKYIFVDALDVDPTFKKYQEDFDYCRQKGLFEAHCELSAMTSNTSSWDMTYWKTLKRNLLENFSEKRLNHMREVAKVIYADKIRRSQEVKTNVQPSKVAPNIQVPPSESVSVSPLPKGELAKKEAERVEKEKAELEEKNRRIREQEAEQKRQTAMRGGTTARKAYSSKKSKGTVPASALLAGVGVAVAVILYLILRK